MTYPKLFAIYGPEWSVVPPEAAEREVLKENKLTTAALDSTTTQYTSRPLPFYDNHRLYRLSSTAESFDTLGLFLLSDGNKPIHLNGSSPPIHELNTSAPLQLSDENALTYLAFFCFFVHGEEGPFMVVDSLENMLLPDFVTRPETTEHKNAVDEIQRLYRPPELFGTDEKGNFRASAMIYYSNVIFVSDFLIGPTGMINMLDDEPLIADLPEKMNALLLRD